MMTKTHYFFMLNPSPWPLVISIASFNFMTSLLMFLKYGDSLIFLSNLVSLSFCSFFWWISYGGEFNLEGKNSFFLESGVKFSMILFISSEIFFFFSFFWSYFHYFLSPTLEVGMSWPPVNIESFDFTNVPLINTLVLMSSGVTITMSHYFLLHNKLKMCKFWLISTVFLGAFFSFLQWSEYNNSFFSISDGNFGTSFFLLTGFHGIHVLVGSLFISLVYLKSKLFSGAEKNFVSFELASWYWHFVDVVWIFLYFLLYYMTY